MSTRSRSTLVRRTFAAWNRGDPEGWLEDIHPEIEARGAVAGHAEGSAFRGLDGMLGWWADLHDAFEEVLLYPDEIRDLGERILKVAGFSFDRKA